VALILLNAFGAQAGTLRGFVENRIEQLDFIRGELTSADPATYDTVVVILPNWRGCLTEPCGPWVGYSTENRVHLSQPSAYRYALATVGIAPETKQIVFSEQPPSAVPPGSILVNWQKFATARRAHIDFLWHHS
jgi:hypothetical protein